MAPLRMTVAEARRQGLLPAAPKRPKPDTVPVRAYAVCLPSRGCATCQAWLVAQGLAMPGIVRREGI